MKKEQDFNSVHRKPADGSENHGKASSINSETDPILNISKEPKAALNLQPKPKAGKVIPLDPKSVNAGRPGKTKNRLMITLALLLSGTLFLILADSLGFNFLNEPNQANAAVESGTNNDAQTAEIQWKIPEEISDDVRDVTGRANRLDIEGKIIVQGIICSEDSRLAMISGRIIKEGDLVMDCRVIEIKPDKVVFQKNGKIWSQKVE